MDHIRIQELEVFYCVGVPHAERARPQRLLLSLDIETNFAEAAASDDLRHTIDYYAVTRRLVTFGEGRSWNLIEKLATDIADLVIAEFGASAVGVEVRKFIIPETRYIAVHTRREKQVPRSPHSGGPRPRREIST